MSSSGALDVRQSILESDGGDRSAGLQEKDRPHNRSKGPATRRAHWHHHWHTHDSSLIAHRNGWRHAFLELDPRRLIYHYFGPGDRRGPLGFLHECGFPHPRYGKEEDLNALRQRLSDDKRLPQRCTDSQVRFSSRGCLAESADPEGEDAVEDAPPSTFFSVWRPTSQDAVRMMITGRAVGKGLNIKGKSAKKGELSGFVPFLQISEEAHKKLVGTSPRDARLRIFYRSAAARATAVSELRRVLASMQAVAVPAEKKLRAEQEGHELDEDERRDAALAAMRWSVAHHVVTDNAAIELIDDFSEGRGKRAAWGIELAERLVMEAYVTRADISHPVGWETGRPSEPAYMDLNLQAVRDSASVPPAVLWQYDTERPMNGRGLLLAYAEAGRAVLPVVSDFDAFTVGSRGVRYESLPEEQQQLLHWQIDNVAAVLDESSPSGWAQRWLGVLKREATRGFHPKPPRFGYGDPTSYSMMEKATERLVASGAVRHGAECFNFHFPQELDAEFLVVWEGYRQRRWCLPGEQDRSPWRYVDVAGLQTFLKERIAEGYAFPLNPKWMLCDPGFYDVYRLQLSSATAQQALEAWLPRASGLRERIEEVRSRHPGGFVRAPAPDGHGAVEAEAEACIAKAEWELRRHMVLHRVREKMRVILRWMRLPGNQEEVERLTGRASRSSRLDRLGLSPAPTVGAPQEAGGVRLLGHLWRHVAEASRCVNGGPTPASAASLRHASVQLGGTSHLNVARKQSAPPVSMAAHPAPSATSRSIDTVTSGGSFNELAANAANATAALTAAVASATAAAAALTDAAQPKANRAALPRNVDLLGHGPADPTSAAATLELCVASLQRLERQCRESGDTALQRAASQGIVGLMEAAPLRKPQ